MLRRLLVRTLLSFGLLCLSAAAAAAQQETATITGTVRDATGAVVPTRHRGGDQRSDRHRVQDRRATDDGTYVIPSLRPGDYSSRSRAPGFQKTVQHGRHAAGRAGGAAST